MVEDLEADDAFEIVVAVLDEHGVSPFLAPSEGKVGGSTADTGEGIKVEVNSLAADLVMAHRLRFDKKSSYRHRQSVQDCARKHQRRVELLTELLESYENELQHKLEPRPGRDGFDQLTDLRERQERIHCLRESIAEEQAGADRIGSPPPHPNSAPGKAIVEIAISMANVLVGNLYPEQTPMTPMEEGRSRIARIIAEMYVRAGIDQRPTEKVEASLYQALRNARL